MCIIEFTKGLQLMDPHHKPLNTKTLVTPPTVLRRATDTETERQADHKPSHDGQYEEPNSERAVRPRPGPLEPERHVSCCSPASNAEALRHPSTAVLCTLCRCGTCGLRYRACPGHFGHIELAVPVYNPLVFG